MNETDSPGPLSRIDAARRAVRQFSSRTGLPIEAVTNLTLIGSVWHVTLQVVESRRVPDTYDVLATYDARLDGRGVLIGADRTELFARGPTLRRLRAEEIPGETG